MSFWRDRRVIVTGGAGFLGSHIVARLRQEGCAQVLAQPHDDYDLRNLDAIQRLLSELRADLVIHAAGAIGGIGANRANPAEFLYDNLMMGVQLLHESWKFGVAKFVAIGTVCAYPKFTPVPFREADLWNGYPEETNAPYGHAKENAPGAVAGLPTAIRVQLHLSFAGEPVWARRQLRSGVGPCDPGLDPKVSGC